MEGPLRFARPTLEGEEPERERGGVCTDIMADWKYTAGIELKREETHCQNSFNSVCNTTWTNWYWDYKVDFNGDIRDFKKSANT